MVIPVEKDNENTRNTAVKMKKYVVIGNNSSIQIKENSSSIRIVGDNCTVQVESGNGNVCYVGNNGAIYLNKSIKEDVVTFVGKNGIISKNGTIRRHSSASDVRNIECEVKVINLNGLSGFSVSSCVRTITGKTQKNFSTTSLPNIQVQMSGHKMHSF